MKFTSRKLKGLTLVELLIVLTVLVILVGITITIINPVRQRQRAQDAALRNAFSSTVSALEAFHSLHGRYPASSDDEIMFDRFMSEGFDVSWGSGTIIITNPSILVGGVQNGQIIYHVQSGGPSGIPCMEAAANEITLNESIAWTPGYAIRNIPIAASCTSGSGFSALTT